MVWEKHHLSRKFPGGQPISFATDVKAELAGLTPARPCCQLSELRGIFHATRGSLVPASGGIAARFRMLRNQVARKVVRLAKLHGIDAHFQAERHPKQLSFSVLLALEPSLVPVFDPDSHEIPSERCDRKALLRGFFLGCGSVNAPSARYHFELVTPDRAWAEAIADMLGDEQVRVGLTERAGHPLLYVKDGDGIVRLLSLMGASRAVMDFENVRVVREVSAQVNRQLNFETANLDKTAGSSSRQIAAIRRLEESGDIERLPRALRDTARMRLLNPELNLVELGRRLQLSKSGINHRLRRLVEAAGRLEGDGTDAS
jgi:cell division protein WhiA